MVIGLVVVMIDRHPLDNFQVEQSECRRLGRRPDLTSTQPVRNDCALVGDLVGGWRVLDVEARLILARLLWRRDPTETI